MTGSPCSQLGNTGCAPLARQRLIPIGLCVLLTFYEQSKMLLGRCRAGETVQKLHSSPCPSPIAADDAAPQKSPLSTPPPKKSDHEPPLHHSTSIRRKRRHRTRRRITARMWMCSPHGQGMTERLPSDLASLHIISHICMTGLIVPSSEDRLV